MRRELRSGTLASVRAACACLGLSCAPLAAAGAGPAPAVAGPQGLSALEKRIRSGEIPNVHSVVVARKGKTLAEALHILETDGVLRPV